MKMEDDPRYHALLANPEFQALRAHFAAYRKDLEAHADHVIEFFARGGGELLPRRSEPPDEVEMWEESEEYFQWQSEGWTDMAIVAKCRQAAALIRAWLATP